MLRDIILVMMGGAVGSALRYLVGALWQVPSAMSQVQGSFPWPTFMVNVVGSFVLGAVAVFSQHQDVLSRHQALLLGTGLCGGFTTFSTFSVETISLIEQQRLDLVAVYITTTIITTLAAAWLGVVAARSIS